MWVGQQLADGLDFWGFLGSLILGGIILGIYTGLLGYVGAKTGLSLDLLSQRAFGEKGSYLPSAMTSSIAIRTAMKIPPKYRRTITRALYFGKNAAVKNA